MNKNENPYKILGVTAEMGDTDIKKAYRKLAMKYHPDKQTTEMNKANADCMFSKISAAYEVVTDPAKRHDWERFRVSCRRFRSPTRSPTDNRPSVVIQSPFPTTKRFSMTSSHKKVERLPPPPSSPGLFRKVRGFSPLKRGDSPSKTRDSSPYNSSTRRVSSPPQSPCTIKGSSVNPRPRPRPHPRPRSPGKLTYTPNKNSSTGSTPSLRARSSSDGTISSSYRPRRGSSTGTRRKFRDPFCIFEEVMEEEYGKDYKKKAASDWNVQGSIKHNRNKKSAAKNVFREVDLNGDEAISKNELSQYVESNSDLWAFLGENLGLDEKTCIDIATQVAFSLAKRQANETSTKQSSSPSNTYELSEKEFKAFFKHYVQSQKGSYEFFLRTIFAVYDVNGDGVLQRQEFENFLNIFYMSKNAYRTKLIDMPSKTKFMRIAEARLDKNKDGVLSFMEVRDLLQVAAVVTCNKTAAAK